MAIDEDSPEIQAAFKIIASVGGANSLYLQAVDAAREGKFDEADDLMEQGDSAFLSAHNVHLKMLQDTAAGEGPELNLMVVHAEDQMVGAETIRLVAQNLIDVYRRIGE